MDFSSYSQSQKSHFCHVIGLWLFILLAEVGCQTVAKNSTDSTLVDSPTDAIPSDIADRLTCYVDVTTCTELASQYQNTIEYEDVCYEMSNDDGPTGEFAPCNLICADYKVMADAGKVNCDMQCPWFADVCIYDLPTYTTPKPWAHSMRCNATGDMCKTSKIRNDNFNSVCYRDNTFPDSDDFKACFPICSPESNYYNWDQCDHKCPDYTQICGIDDTTTQTNRPQTQFPPQPWTDNPTCDVTEEMCKSIVVPHNENFNLSCYRVDTNPSEPEYRPCQPICTSDSGRDIDACEYYCPGYLEACGLTTSSTITSQAESAAGTGLPLMWKIIIPLIIVGIVVVAIVGYLHYKKKLCKRRYERANSSGDESEETSFSTNS